MTALTVQTQHKYKSLVTKKAYVRGEVISLIPSTATHDEANQYTVQVDRNRHVEVGKFAFINHSCNPNVIMDTSRMLAVAARDIALGEELTFFYPSTEWEMSTPFICICGSPNCVHVVAGARFLPLSTLEHYYVNAHIRSLLVDMLNKTEVNYPLVIQNTKSD